MKIVDVRCQIESQVQYQIWYRADSQVFDQVGFHLRAPVDYAYAQVDSRIKSVRLQVKREVESQI